MSAIAIHRAVVADLEDLRLLFAQYRVFYKQQPDAAGEHRFLHERLTHHDSTIFIARQEQASVGFVQLFLTYSTVALAPNLLLEDLFVKEEARGQGVARALLDRAKAHATQLNAASMYLETAHSNRTAQRLYEAAGWKLENVFRKYNCPLDQPAPP